VVRARVAGTRLFTDATDRLVAHVVSFGAEARSGLESPDELDWLCAIDDELDQIRVVLGILDERDPQAARELAAALGPYWLHRGLLGEGRAHLVGEASPVATRRVSTAVAARAAAWEARLAADQGVLAQHRDAARMLTALRSGLETARRSGDVHDELRALDFLSHVLVLHGDPRAATTITDEGIALARRHDRPWWLTQLLQRSAVFARLRGDTDQAGRLAREAATIARAIGAARPLLHVGLTLVQLPDEATRSGAGTGRDGFGTDDVPTLADLAEMADEVGDRRMACVVGTSIGIEAMFDGDVGGAAHQFARVLRLATDTGYWHATGFALMSITALAALVHRPDTVARLHATTVGWSDVLQRGMPPAYFDLYHRLVDDTRRSVGDDAFGRWMDEARSLDFARATVLANRFLDEVAADHDVADDRELTPAVNPLTRRELEVLRCIAAGDTNKDVARHLAISPKTVMHHTTSIYRKLGAHGRAEATATALRLGLLDP
jgi:DNA-binding CsgD family transcriptional regulator